MSASGFTPGPWHYPGTGTFIGGPDRARVADVFGLERTSVERIANAHLIAAAPELYAALCLAHVFVQDGAEDGSAEARDLLREIDAVLAKARGEGGAA